MPGIIRGWVSAESGDNRTYIKCGGNAHNRTEKHLRPYKRKGYKPKLLVTVSDSVNSARLIIAFIYPLKRRYQRKETGTETHPQRYDNDYRHYIFCILQELNRLLYEPDKEFGESRFGLAVCDIHGHIGRKKLSFTDIASRLKGN